MERLYGRRVAFLDASEVEELGQVDELAFGFAPQAQPVTQGQGRPAQGFDPQFGYVGTPAPSQRESAQTPSRTTQTIPDDLRAAARDLNAAQSPGVCSAIG